MTESTELSAGYAAMQRSCAAVRGTRDVISASGPDTLTFLQGQLSQDLAAMADGESRWSLLLQPQGKVDAWLRLTRRTEQDWLLDVDAGFADAVVTRLRRFLLRTKCTIEQLDWQSASLRGPSASAELISSEVVVGNDDWGVAGFDAFGPTVTFDPAVGEATAADLDILRIEAGIPAMGRELTEDTIPAAAGIVDRSVSFTKGCYTGQELVARIDSRGGNVPQTLRLVTAANPSDGGGGELVDQDGKSAGRITSWVWSPAQGRAIGLAYVARRVAVPNTLTVAGSEGPVEVAELPVIA